MNKQTYFSFLESLNGPKAVVEAIKIGYSICFESQFSERMQGFKNALEGDSNFRNLIDQLQKVMLGKYGKDTDSLELDLLNKIHQILTSLTTESEEINNLWWYIDQYHFIGRFKSPNIKKILPFYHRPF